jgi:hypothetical protein
MRSWEVGKLEREDSEVEEVSEVQNIGSQNKKSLS